MLVYFESFFVIRKGAKMQTKKRFSQRTQKKAIELHKCT